MNEVAQQQYEYWNGPGGQRWAAAQDRIDHHIGILTEALMAFVVPKKGERILDIGCGGGTTAFMLREKVGPNGSVTGVDISAPNLALARARCHAANADVTFIEADASAYDFQPSFDLAFSRFGVMFFADPVAAFANIRKALVPGGRLAFVCWRAMKENDWALVPFASAKDLLPPQPPVDPNAPGPFAFADADRVRSVLHEARYRDVLIKPHDTIMNMGASVEDAVDEALTIGPLARAAAELDEPVRAEIRARITPELGRYQTKTGITPPAAVWFVDARA